MLILLFLSPWTTLFVAIILPSNEHGFLSSTKRNRLFIQDQWKQTSFSILWAFVYMLNDCVNSRPYQRRLPLLRCILNLTFLVTFRHVINLFMPFSFQFCYYFKSVRSLVKSWNPCFVRKNIYYFGFEFFFLCHNISFSPFKRQIFLLSSPYSMQILKDFCIVRECLKTFFATFICIFKPEICSALAEIEEPDF